MTETAGGAAAAPLVPDRELAARAARLLEALRQRRPLVHHITNRVVTHSTANLTLALGASPVMAYAPEEVAEMAAAAQALLLNIGTLTAAELEAALVAGRAANAAGVPVLLDPVGAGATRFRLEACHRILDEVRVAVLRGNADEMAALAGEGGGQRGVDAVRPRDDAERAELARRVARRYGCVAAVTGARDWLSDGERGIACDNGHPLLAQVTGTGCMASTAVAAFLAAGDEPLEAAAAALGAFGLAAEWAARDARGPGSFEVALLDRVAALRPVDLEEGLRLARLEGGEGR
ncbi:MAG: hydroxyethylthiazole kinase [Firmicutes bacterium]|nr:hydroxyethylthiazole kinase [Bacillota bacterium]